MNRGQNNPIRVLVANDKVSVLWALGRLIQGEMPRMMPVGTARTTDETLIYACLRPDVIVLDLELDGCCSLEILPQIRERSAAHILIHSGLGDRRLHEDAILLGARGVVRKDESAQTLLEAIERVHHGEFWNVDRPAVIAYHPAERSATDRFAELGIAFLSPGERQTIADLVEHWYASPAAPSPPKIAPAALVSIYNKLGLRNRADLAVFAARHGLVRADTADRLPAT